jgi:hypothetical protein
MLKAAGAVLAACAVSGCAALPPQTEYRGVSVNDLVDAVQCELRLGSHDGGQIAPNLKDHVASAELELRLTDTSNIGASAVWVAPTGPELLTASLGISSGGFAARTAKLEFSVELKNLHKKVCLHGRTGLPSVPDGLGLSNWVRSAFQAAREDDVTKVSEATYKLEFVLTQGANGGINVVSTKFRPAMIGGGASREDRHILTVTLARKAGPSTQQVEIVKWPAQATAKTMSRSAGDKPKIRTFAVEPDTVDRFQFSRERLDRERPTNLQLNR